MTERHGPPRGSGSAAVDARRPSVDGSGWLRTRTAVPPRGVRCARVRGASGRGARDRRRLDPQRQRTHAVDHRARLGRRRGRTDRERARVVAQRPLDQRPDGCGRSRGRWRLHDPGRRGSLPPPRQAHGRLRPDDGATGDERTKTAGAARRRRARAPQPAAGDPRLARRHARRPLPRGRGAAATAARRDRGDVAAPGGSPDAFDGGGGRADAGAGDGRPAPDRRGGRGRVPIGGG